MNARQKIHQTNLALWTQRIQEQANSGLTIKAWCAETGLSIHRYNYWKHLIKEAYVDQVLPDIIPVPIAPATLAADNSLSTISQSPLTPSCELHNSYNSCNNSATTRSPESHVSCDSYNTIQTLISVGDVRIEVGPHTSDKTLLALIKAVRHA